MSIKSSFFFFLCMLFLSTSHADSVSEKYVEKEPEWLDDDSLPQRKDTVFVSDWATWRKGITRFEWNHSNRKVVLGRINKKVRWKQFSNLADDLASKFRKVYARRSNDDDIKNYMQNIKIESALVKIDNRGRYYLMVSANKNEVIASVEDKLIKTYERMETFFSNPNECKDQKAICFIDSSFILKENSGKLKDRAKLYKQLVGNNNVGNSEFHAKLTDYQVKASEIMPQLKPNVPVVITVDGGDEITQPDVSKAIRNELLETFISNGYSSTKMFGSIPEPSKRNNDALYVKLRYVHTVPFGEDRNHLPEISFSLEVSIGKNQLIVYDYYTGVYTGNLNRGEKVGQLLAKSSYESFKKLIHLLAIP